MQFGPYVLTLATFLSKVIPPTEDAFLNFEALPV